MRNCRAWVCGKPPKRISSSLKNCELGSGSEPRLPYLYRPSQNQYQCLMLSRCVVLCFHTRVSLLTELPQAEFRRRNKEELTKAQELAREDERKAGIRPSEDLEQLVERFLYVPTFGEPAFTIRSPC